MKKIFLMLFALLSLVAKAQNTSDKSSADVKGIIFFNGTFAEALAEAKKTNKALFVDFYAVWCVPCKHMAKNVFTLKEVGDYMNKHFISLQIDAEKPENVEIAKQYKVEAYPTVAFIDADGKPLSVNVGALGKEELLEAAQIAAGESVSFDDLYKKYKANPQDLAVQQELLLKAPSFLQAQDGIEADKWVTRIQKIYQNYVATKNPKELINANDYRIILTLEGEDNKEHKLGIVNMINSNIDEWTKVLGKAPAFYIVEANDAFAEDYAKEANVKYKDYVDNVKNLYAKAYSIIAQPGINSYEHAQLYNDALYNLYKNKDVKGYIKAMQNEDHQQAIQWVTKALQGDDAVMDRVNYIVMIGDSYRALKDYNKAREYYNQGFAESLRMENMEMPQAMVQGAIKQKLATLELLEK